MPQQCSETNDYVPLAFLLGSRANDYVGKLSNRPTSICQDHPRFWNQRKPNRIDLLPTDMHPRQREIQARKCLQQLLTHSQPEQESSRNDTAVSACFPLHATPLSPRYVDRADVLQKPLESMCGSQQHAETDGVTLGSTGHITRPNEEQQQNELRLRAFHEYTRDAPDFLNVAGCRTRIVHGSSQELREQTRAITRKKQALRVQRIQELRALLQEQQVQTRSMLKQHENDMNQQQHLQKQVVSPYEIHFNNNTGDEEETSKNTISLPSSFNHNQVNRKLPAQKSDKDRRERETMELESLREHLRAKKELDEVTRQQKMEFRQQQKRLLGRANTKKPSFLATLQLDEERDSSSNESPFAIPTDFDKQQQRHHEEDLPCGSEGTRLSLLQQQRSVFLRSDERTGGIVFGGGFMAATAAKTTRHPSNQTVDTRDGSGSLFELETILASAAVHFAEPMKHEPAFRTTKKKQHRNR